MAAGNVAGAAKRLTPLDVACLLLAVSVRAEAYLFREVRAKNRWAVRAVAAPLLALFLTLPDAVQVGLAREVLRDASEPGLLRHDETASPVNGVEQHHEHRSEQCAQSIVSC